MCDLRMHLLCGLPCCVLGVVFGSAIAAQNATVALHTTMPKGKKVSVHRAFYFVAFSLVAVGVVLLGVCFLFLLFLLLPSVSSCAQRHWLAILWLYSCTEVSPKNAVMEAMCSS